MSDEEPEEVTRTEVKVQETQILDLKMAKSRAKAVYTRARNRLHDYLIDDELDRDQCKEELDKVEGKMDKAIEIDHQLAKLYHSVNKTKEKDKVLLEVEIEKQYDETMELYHRQIARSVVADNARSDIAKSDQLDTSSSEKGQIGKDLWKQLKRVSIPIFTGDKVKYPAWKAAFYSCIDEAPSTPEFKLLQLRQYVSGEALNCIENLGHSAAAYSAAKERLERKFGGAQRVITRFLDELENFTPIKNESVKEIERFSDLLDIAVINLKEYAHTEDLKDGSLYYRLLKKLPQTMLTRYNRKVDEQKLEASVETLRNFVNCEAEYAIRASETIHGLSQKENTKHAKQSENRVYHNQKESDSVKQTERKCALCQEAHGIWECKSFKDLNENERWEKAKELKLCYRCLGGGHLAKKCKHTRICGIGECKKTHHKLLHKNVLNPAAVTFQSVFTNTACKDAQTIALRTVPVIVIGENKQLKINALLDDGSTTTYINSDIATELGLKGTKHSSKVNILNGKSETFETTSVNLEIISENGQIKMQIEAKTIANVTGNLETIDWNKHSQKWDHLRGIDFPQIGRNKKVDMLIGLDYSDLHRSLYEVFGKKGEPFARLTPLGWTCVGIIGENSCRATHNATTYFVTEKCDCVRLQDFWETEAISVQPNLGEKDYKIKDGVEEGIEYDNQTNRYSVPIPWNERKIELHDNREMAITRLQSTEKRLQKDPSLYKEYAEIVNMYETKNYVSKINPNSEKKWFLPHFPVVRREKSTTKVRLVFDASAKHHGISLNDAIHQGPKLQNELIDVILRFRKQKIALMCDIREMYLQVGIIESDRTFFRFLWRDKSTDEIDEYQFNRVPFGMNASPFLAQFVSQYNARKFEEHYPLAAEAVIKSTYMDDTMDSVKSEELGIELYNQLQNLWQKASMSPRKWLSNSPDVLAKIPKELRSFETEIYDTQLPAVKTLGLLWNAEIDQFTFSGKPADIESDYTKRQFLSKLSSVFDPLGFVSPYIILGKILMQEVWLDGSDWDEPLSTDLQTKVRKWLSEMPSLSQVKIDRNMNITEQCQFHTFVDASSEAYGAVVYTCTENDVKFVIAKSRVAPLKAISIPRLELMGAVLGLQLTQKVCTALNVDIGETIFWSDSMNVLWWIHGHSRQFKSFVANRVGLIQTETKPQQWRYVPTKQNPADLITRGTSVERLSTNSLWWHGPNFLPNKEEWPQNTFQADNDAKAEVKSKMKFCTETYFNSIENPNENRLDPTRYSDFTHLCRIMAWTIRFIENCQVQKANRRIEKELSVQEIQQAENKLIACAQIEGFKNDYDNLSKGGSISKSSKLLPLSPVIDSEGIIRSNSRLQFAEFLPENTKYPVILPRKNWITKLIVKQSHEKTNHSGTNQTLADLMTNYWIICAREEIREWENTCAECKRKKSKPENQIMGPLPVYRIGNSMKAFTYPTNTAVDFAGPFLTKQGRGRSREKRYLCVFTCMECRAVHFEIAFGLDTDSFLNCFYRFVCRRGLPKMIVSDNGSNFVGSVRELKDLYEQIDKLRVTRDGANKKVTWHFIPPYAPHFGGVHEAMVKCAKRALYHVLKNTDITDEELMSAFVGAEDLVNSRPLTYQTSNPGDNLVLTPNHFLHGQMGGKFAPETVDLTRFDVRKRWRYVQELMKHFWTRWLKEYLPILGARKKWFQQKRDFKSGDIVLIVDPSLPRGQWSIGRITEVFVGRDGHVRMADVQSGKNVMRRPITRLCLLEESSK